MINLNNVTPLRFIDLLAILLNLIQKFTISFFFANYFQSIALNKLKPKIGTQILRVSVPVKKT